MLETLDGQVGSTSSRFSTLFVLKWGDKILGSSPSRLRHLDSASGPEPRPERLGHPERLLGAPGCDRRDGRAGYDRRVGRDRRACRYARARRAVPCAPCAPRRAAIRPNQAVTC